MSRTVWEGRDLPAMWWSAQAADTSMAWQQVSAWQRSYELLDYYATQLRIARTELTAAWPAEPGSAAASFVAYLDGLLLSITNAAEDAVANRQALLHVLSSLSTAKTDMAKLKDKWDEYEAEDLARSKNLSNILPHSAGADWRMQLNEAARARMTRNDQEVLEATGQMIVPTGFDAGIDRHESNSVGPTSQVGVWGKTPGHLSGSANTANLLVPPDVQSVLAPDTGVGLAGRPVQPATDLPTPERTEDGVRHPPVASTLPGSAPSFPLGNARSSSTPSGEAGSAGFGSAVRGRPGSDPAGPTHPGAASTSVGRRINPVGGVIEAHGGATAVGAPIVGAGRSAAKHNPLQERDFYVVWEITQGVPPIIEPAPERRHDAGWGVIGIDR